MNPWAWGRGVRERVDAREVPAEVLRLVEERLGGKLCPDCRRLGLTTPPGEPLELDHQQPLAKGGDNHHLNLRWSCRGHNRGRSDRPLRKRPPLPAWARRRRGRA